MNQNKSKIEPTPNYKIEYGDEYLVSLKNIKNSYRGYKNDKKEEDRNRQMYNRKNSRSSCHSILSIKSNARYEKNYK